MARPLDIPSLSIGTRVEDAFLVRDVEVRSQAQGDPFTVLTLGNATGTIATEPFWAERADEIAGLRRGHVVRVIGEVAAYRDRKQIKVVSIRHLLPQLEAPPVMTPALEADPTLPKLRRWTPRQQQTVNGEEGRGEGEE